MLVGKNIPMPAPSRHQGPHAGVREGPGTDRRCRSRSSPTSRPASSPLNGDARVPAKLRHLTTFRPSSAASAPVTGIIVTGGTGGAAAPVTPPSALPSAARNWMSINQARDQGLLPGSWSTNGAFRTAKHRAAKAGIQVPKVQATRKGEALYDAIELADFLERIAA